MKRFLLAILLSASLGTASSAQEAAPSGSIHLTNGAIASSYDHCADMDLCAKIVYPNGNVLSIYSEGAAECQPYFLHFVFADSTKTLF